MVEVMKLFMDIAEKPGGELDPVKGFEQLIEKEKEYLGARWPGIGEDL